MDNIIQEYNIKIDLENDPNFQWTNTLLTEPVIDWEKLQYQNHYKRREFVESKFRGHWEHIPGFDKIITKITERITSPLEEINERYYITNENRDNTDFSEFKNSQ